jgi:hypothetical protein
MNRTTNKVGKKEVGDLQLYILPFKNESCFKIGITFDIYDRGSQLGFANFQWAAGYLVQASENHTITGIESFLKNDGTTIVGRIQKIGTGNNGGDGGKWQYYGEVQIVPEGGGDDITLDFMQLKYVL